MGKLSDAENREFLRERLIGLGEHSFRKSHYPELQGRLDQLERFRALLDHTRDIILLASLPSAEIVDANWSACRQLGYESSELQGLSIERVVEMEALQWPEEGGLEEETLTTVMRRRDGSSFPVEITICVDRFDTDSYLLAVGRDISERLRAAEGLRKALCEAEEARDKIDAILRSTADGLLVADMEGKVVLLNQAAEKLLGVDSTQVAGRGVESVLAERSAGVPDHFPEEGECELRLTEEGKTKFLQARSSPIRDSKGRLRGRVLSLQDRTRDREIDRMKTEFISTAAHEFRTPLTSIQGFSEILLERELPPQEQREFLTYIHEKSVALGYLVGDLLDIARIESGQELRLNCRLWSVREIFDQIVPLLRSDRRRHRFRLSLDNPELLLPVDRGKMGQVLENLFSNAMKYSPEGTLIRLAAGQEDGFFRISVIDEGIGMTPAEAERVFDKFYRADASNRAVGGVGLGMSIARSIVEAHGGKIEVASRKGEGTTVTLTLPLESEGLKRGREEESQGPG